MKKIISPIIIMAILAFVFYTVGVKSVGIIEHTDTLKVYSDTGTHTTSLGKPYPVFRDTGSIEYFPVPVDSAAIFEAYAKLHHLHYTKNIYSDTLKNDTSALIVLNDTVFKNELQNRSLTYQNRTPVYYITKTLQMPQRNQWYFGGDVTGIRGRTSFDVSVIFERKRVAYRYAYDPLVGEHSIGAYVRVFPRSRSPAKN